MLPTCITDRMMAFSRCCCYFDLRSGAIIIAVLDIVGGTCAIAAGTYWHSCVLAAVSFVSGAFLLMGAIRYDRIATLLSLISLMITIVFYAITAILLCVHCSDVDKNGDPDCEKEFITAGVFFFAGGFVNIYFWLCVFTFYEGIRSGVIHPSEEPLERSPSLIP